MKTLIRADSSSTIGLGHIMRDIALAKQCEGEIIFACQPLEGNSIERIPYEVKLLTSNDADELILLIKSLQITLLIIDHYGIDIQFEKQIKRATGVMILSVDDTYTPHHCDILLNHNICANASRYASLVPKHCEVRCGTPLIREEFYLEKAIEREKIYDVCIAMGGTDAKNLTLKILKKLPPSLRVAILTTTSNAHLQELQHALHDHAHITLHVNSNEVAKLLHQSRFAIVTPSVIVHEVLFMEIPFIAIKVAENQDDMYQYLRQNGYKTMETFDENSTLNLS